MKYLNIFLLYMFMHICISFMTKFNNLFNDYIAQFQFNYMLYLYNCVCDKQKILNPEF